MSEPEPAAQNLSVNLPQEMFGGVWDPDIKVLGPVHDAIGAPLGIPQDATFTRKRSSAVAEPYFARVAESQTLPAPRMVTIVTIPREEPLHRGGSLEDYAYLYMGADPEVVAENASQRARLSRRGRDALAD